ncbi:WhiB family transcriptional regulator [Nocardia sp. NPDC049220]|uniref:WhiB family transcriptional regulator n=1 Tax=Nocardia sp. NPDC049220 TaxID=3155273 RepID=UPI0033CA3A3D
MTSRYRRPKKQWPKVAPPIANLVSPQLVDAACVGMAPLFDYEIFGESPENQEARWWRGRGVCARCPVRIECSATAGRLGVDAQGIWAGLLRMPTDLRKSV